MRRAYREANGDFAIITFEEPRPGLSILPLTDPAYRQEQPKAEGQQACGGCGHVLHSPQAPQANCPRCAQRKWQPAVLG